MAIKKQNKRSIEETKPAPSQNGEPNKKAQKPAKKIKLEKPSAVPSNGVPQKKVQKANKSNVKAEAKVAKVKKEVPAQTPEQIAAKIESKKLKNAAKFAKKKENRKEARKADGQYKPEKIKMSAEQIQLRIDAIKSRPELTKTAKRRLVALRKRLQVAQGTYVPKPKPDPAVQALTKSQKQHKKKLRRKAEKLANELKDKKNVSEEGTTEVDTKTAITSTKQKAIVAALNPAVKKEKLIKNEKKTQQQPKGKQAKKIVKKEEPEDEENDDDEDAEDEEDSNEEVDTSAANIANVTAENDDDDEEEEEDDDDDEEEEEDDDDDDDEEEKDGEDAEEEVKVPAKKIKQEPGKKIKQEPETKVKQQTEKKQFAKKGESKAQDKNEPATNGESEDGKKKRYVLFVGNLSYESTAEDIKKHFLTKVGEVSSVRVPTKPGSNSPRGFAYVEVTNDTDYEKGLSLHNTQLNGRRLNVEYTRGGSKSVGNRSDVVSKNKKLHAMRKQGMLAGSQKDGHKRNDRRQKAKQGPTKSF